MRKDGSNLRRELEKEWKGQKEMKVKKKDSVLQISEGEMFEETGASIMPKI